MVMTTSMDIDLVLGLISCGADGHLSTTLPLTVEGIFSTLEQGMGCSAFVATVVVGFRWTA